MSMRRKFARGALAAFLVLAGAGCSHAPKPTTAGAPAPATAQALGVAIATITPTQGNDCRGTVRFTALPDGSVQVVADLSGLAPNTRHGIHVHETGDCTAPDAMSAGGHYNPTHAPHGLPPDPDRHAGDLGNLTADAQGNAHYEITVTNLSLSNPSNGVLGRAVIVHAQPDDGGQPAGNAGARVGCGVISVPGPAPQN